MTDPQRHTDGELVAIAYLAEEAARWKERAERAEAQVLALIRQLQASDPASERPRA